MGFLIFALRKLMLKREINQKQSRLICLVQDIQRNKNQISIMQQAMAESKNAAQQLMQNTSSIFDNVYAAQYAVNNQTASEAMRKYQDASNSKAPKDAASIANVDTLKEEMEKAARTATDKNQALIMTSQAGKHALLAMNYATENVFSAVDKSQIQAMSSKETTMELEKESLESDLMVLQEDYKSNKEAEKEAAKSVAVNLSGGG